jgi:hypothetical protein
MKNNIKLSLLAASATFAACCAQAQVLYSENFEADATANWTVNKTTGAQAADLFFDYSTVGIPSAPNSTGGSTRGMKLQANLVGTTGVFPGGVSASPNGRSFGGDYKLRFDMWMNFNGPMPAGGSGTTQAGGAGIGTAGDLVQVAGSPTVNSLFFSTTVDGGSATDYRAYSSSAAGGYTEASGVFAAGNAAGVRNNTHPYYASFAGQPAPAAQLALFPGQTGTANVGTLAFAWHDVVIEKLGSTVTWSVDGKLIATVDTTGLTFSGGNILFNHYDTNATASTDPNSAALLFTLIDNIQVIPEPTTASVVGLGLALLALGRRRR